MPERAATGIPESTAAVELTEQGYLHLPGDMAELYFPDQAGAEAFLSELPDDGINQWIERLELRTSGTEMIGIP